MVPRRAADAFMALLRTYHSRRFCRAAALGARSGVAASSRFSTSTQLAASVSSRRKDGRPARPKPPPSAPSGIFSKDFELPKQVAIIGAGITGLTTAHYLAKWLPETSQITIYDAADRTGGWINTQTVDVEFGGKKFPVRFERGPRTLRGMGKDTWKFDDLVLWDLMRDLDMMGDYVGKRSPPRYLYYPDHLAAMTPRSIINEPVFKDAIPGMLHFLWCRLMVRNGWKETKPDMSVAEFVKFATGSQKLVDNMVSGMIHGIWGGDVDKLSMRSFMPSQWWRFHYNWRSRPRDKRDRVLMPRQEILLLETLGRDKELRARLHHTRKDQLVMFKDGMSSLSSNIERGLRKRKNVHFKLGEPVVDLGYNEKADKAVITSKTAKAPVLFDKVISTTTSNVLHDITAGAVPILANSPNVSIMAVNVWYPQPKLNEPYEGVGYLVPRSVGDNLEGLLGVFFDSDVLPRAEGEPEGTKFFVLMGGHYWNDMDTKPSEEEGIKMAKNVLERHLGIPAETPCFAMAHYAKDCIPQHHVGHRERMDRAATELEFAFNGRVAVAGGSYTGIGVTSGIRAAYDLASHMTQSAQLNVGETGLGQFQEYEPERWHTTRASLHRMGRDISLNMSMFQRIFA